MGGESDEKRMRLRYAGTCRVCALDLPAKAEAIYERQTKTVRCVDHVAQPADTDVPAEITAPVPAPVVDPGAAGASARREYERRRAGRQERIRARHPKLGGLILAVTDDPQSTSAWQVGAMGEERLGKGLDAIAGETVRLLHDRRVPRTRANIDHLAVTRNGIFVIDAKRYRGRPHLRTDGGILRPRTERLFIGTRDCSKLVDGVLKQMDVVRALLPDDVPLHGALCFLDADWPLLGGNFTTRGVQGLWPKKLYPQLQREGPLSTDDVAELHRALAGHLPPS